MGSDGLFILCKHVSRNLDQPLITIMNLFSLQLYHQKMIQKWQLEIVYTLYTDRTLISIICSQGRIEWQDWLLRQLRKPLRWQRLIQVMWISYYYAHQPQMIYLVVLLRYCFWQQTSDFRLKTCQRRNSLVSTGYHKFQLLTVFLLYLETYVVIPVTFIMF